LSCYEIEGSELCKWLTDCPCHSLQISKVCYCIFHTFAVGSVARFCSRPTKEHWVVVKHILRHLKGTVNHGLVYSKKDDITTVWQESLGGEKVWQTWRIILDLPN